MRVYKFLDAQFGIKSLAEKRLKISTVEDLNDPFELLPFGMADDGGTKSRRAFPWTTYAVLPAQDFDG